MWKSICAYEGLLGGAVLIDAMVGGIPVDRQQLYLGLAGFPLVVYGIGAAFYYPVSITSDYFEYRRERSAKRARDKKEQKGQPEEGAKKQPKN